MQESLERNTKIRDKKRTVLVKEDVVGLDITGNNISIVNFRQRTKESDPITNRNIHGHFIRRGIADGFQKRVAVKFHNNTKAVIF